MLMFLMSSFSIARSPHRHFKNKRLTCVVTGQLHIKIMVDRVGSNLIGVAYAPRPLTNAAISNMLKTHALRFSFFIVIAK